jgi:hypothetical protein
MIRRRAKEKQKLWFLGAARHRSRGVVTPIMAKGGKVPPAAAKISRLAGAVSISNSVLRAET